MPYPETPFADDFNDELVIPTKHCQEYQPTLLKDIKKWLCKTPAVTSIRINQFNSECCASAILNEIESYLNKLYRPRNIQVPLVAQHKQLKSVILIEHVPTKHLNLETLVRQVVVDHVCAAAVLRGAHIFAPGVVGMTKDCKFGDRVSIYADTNRENRCTKGFSQVWQSAGKVFIGNGTVKLSRYELFSSESSSVATGVAIEVTDTISGCPPIDKSFLHRHCAMLQNVPSVVCVEVLNPEKHEQILDMCASPGGKTVDIALRMQNTGLLIALDKTSAKVDQLNATLSTFHINPEHVRTYVADSTKIANGRGPSPHFESNSFDRILLDAPCSALGNRPQLLNRDSESVLRSFVPLQRKLIETAYKLLKVNGTLVYSTCSIAMPENEGVVSWALKRFNWELVKCEPHLADVGLPCDGVTHPEYLQRFGPYSDDNIASIGFFIAKFRKC